MAPSYLDELARRVARSFALTLKGLPKEYRESITLTYLLARYADTISDCGNWTTHERLIYLDQWEKAILHLKPELFKLTHSVGSFSEAEASLLLEGENLLKVFIGFSSRARDASQEVLKILISAMKWDLNTFDALSALKFGIKDRSAFDWYCFSIAGCVGAYWVRAFDLDSHLEPLAVAYGKALQRINILRDVVGDYKIKRVYLPISDLQKHDLQFDTPFWTQPNWKYFVSEYIAETRRLLLYGANFCDSIGYLNLRLRWASSLPLHIGWKTLDQLEAQDDWNIPQKISRSEVKDLAIRSLFAVFFNRSTTKKYQRKLK